MTQDSFFVALGVYALVVLSPGPAFVFMTKVGLQEERAVAFFSMLGYVCGATMNAALAMFVVGTLVERHAGIGLVVSLVGGGFLLYLAAGSFKKARDGRVQSNLTREEKGRNKKREKGGDKSRSRIVGFQSGLLVSLSNPKAVAFFVAVFAPLVVGLPVGGKGLLLVFGFCFKFLWYGSVVFVFRRAGVQGFYRRNGVVCDGLLGVVLAGMGGVVLLEMGHYWGELF